MTIQQTLFVVLLANFLMSFGAPESTGLTHEGKDSAFIRKLYDTALLSGESYMNLKSLCKDIGHRLSGSQEAERAIAWAKERMEAIGYDTVYLQEIKAPHWERGEGNRADLFTRIKETDVPLRITFTALGGSVATGGVLRAPVLEVNSFEDLAEKQDQVKGKVVFFNCPMDKRFIDPFKAYGACASYRYSGASEAAAYGAVAVMVRSLTTLTDFYAHTGSMQYKEGVEKIPAIAVSTMGADHMHRVLSMGRSLELELELHCKNLPDKITYNVIGEVKGSRYPDHYMIVGGHLDSWDLGEGAHDDGAGSVQSMEAIRLLLINGYRPLHSMRTVLFMNEENGNMGGETYARTASDNGEIHLLAIESDRGGFSPRGFTMVADDGQIEAIGGSFRNLLEPYGLHILEAGFGGVDIYPLGKPDNQLSDQLILMGLVPDPQRYFDYHHSKADVFEAVNQRELELGGASLSAMLYLMDGWWDSLFNAG